MPASARCRYTEDFKLEAVRLVREAAHPVAPVARDLGIPKNVLYCWRVQHQQAETHCTTRATQGAEAEALTHVKREVARGTPEQNPGDPPRVPRDYGSPSIWDALIQQGHGDVERRIVRLMRRERIRAKTVRSGAPHPVDSSATRGPQHAQSSVHGDAAQPGVGRGYHLGLDHGGLALSCRDPRFVRTPRDRWARGFRLTVEVVEQPSRWRGQPGPHGPDSCTTRIAAANRQPRITSICSVSTASPRS